MTRPGLFLKALADHPEGLTGNQLWEMHWGEGVDRSHGVKPDEPWSTLDRLCKKGLVTKAGGGPGRAMTWKLKT